MPAIIEKLDLQVLQKLVVSRLWGEDDRRRGAVVWQDRGSTVVVYPETLKLALARGWMAAQVDMETDQTGREPVQVVYFLGRRGEGGGRQATSTLDGADTSGLATRWGEALQTTIWEGFLDALEQLAAKARARARGAELRVAGYVGGDAHVEVALVERGS